MFSRKWWGKTLERMAKTAAGTLLSFLGADKLFTEVDWGFAWQFTVSTVLMSFLGAILTTNMGPDHEDPSAV